MFAVPGMTLRDRVLVKISIDVVKPGPESMFNREEDLTLVEHLETMTQMGYGYTHAQLKMMTADLAVTLGKRISTHQLSNITGFIGFGSLERADKYLKPRVLESSRAKGITLKTINSWKEYWRSTISRIRLTESSIWMKQAFSPSTVHQMLSLQGGTNHSLQLHHGEQLWRWLDVNAVGNSLSPFFIFKG